MGAIASGKTRWTLSILLALLCGAGVTGLRAGDSFHHWLSSYGMGVTVPRRAQLELWFMKEIPWEEPAAACMMPGTTYFFITERFSLNARFAQIWYGDAVSNSLAHRRTTITIPAWFIVLVTLALIALISGRDVLRQVRRSQRGFAVIMTRARPTFGCASAPRTRPAVAGRFLRTGSRS